MLQGLNCKDLESDAWAASWLFFFCHICAKIDAPSIYTSCNYQELYSVPKRTRSREHVLQGLEARITMRETGFEDVGLGGESDIEVDHQRLEIKVLSDTSAYWSKWFKLIKCLGVDGWVEMTVLYQFKYPDSAYKAFSKSYSSFISLSSWSASVQWSRSSYTITHPKPKPSSLSRIPSFQMTHIPDHQTWEDPWHLNLCSSKP